MSGSCGCEIDVRAGKRRWLIWRTDGYQLYLLLNNLTVNQCGAARASLSCERMHQPWPDGGGPSPLLATAPPPAWPWRGTRTSWGMTGGIWGPFQRIPSGIAWSRNTGCWPWPCAPGTPGPWCLPCTACPRPWPPWGGTCATSPCRGIDYNRKCQSCTWARKLESENIQAIRKESADSKSVPRNRTCWWAWKRHAQQL